MSIRKVACFECREGVTAASWDDVWFCATCWVKKFGNRRFQEPPPGRAILFRPTVILNGTYYSSLQQDASYLLQQEDEDYKPSSRRVQKIKVIIEEL